VAGVLAGRAVGSPGALGLDAASPMVLLALVLPALHEPRTRRAALLGAAIALAAAPFLPGGLPVLLALLGLVALGRPGRGRPGAEAGSASRRGAAPPGLRSKRRRSERRGKRVPQERPAGEGESTA
jgi:hypothetical protein